VTAECFVHLSHRLAQSGRLSVRHTLALYQNGNTYNHEIFTVGYSVIPVLKIISVSVSIKLYRNHFSSVSVSVFTSFQYRCNWQFNYQTASSSLTQTASLLEANSSTIQSFYFPWWSRDWKIKGKKFRTCHDFSRKVETLLNARTPALTTAGSRVNSDDLE